MRLSWMMLLCWCPNPFSHECCIWVEWFGHVEVPFQMAEFFCYFLFFSWPCSSRILVLHLYVISLKNHIIFCDLSKNIYNGEKRGGESNNSKDNRIATNKEIAELRRHSYNDRWEKLIFYVLNVVFDVATDYCSGWWKTFSSNVRALTRGWG